MIQSLQLKNFQSHADSFLSFHPGVNAITGPSDSGKTALLRALNWLVNNRPSGEAFRSRWGGDVEVGVRLAENKAVVRGLDKKGGYYLADVNELRAFRTEVPEPVQQLLNLDTVNLQAQHDGPFLLAASPGEVARELNRVARLDVIDSALSAALSRSRSVGAALKAEEARIPGLEEQVRGLDWLEEADAALARLESAQCNIDTITTRRQVLIFLRRNAQTEQTTLTGLKAKLSAQEPLKKAETAFKRLEGVKKRLSALRGVKGEGEAQKRALEAARGLLGAAGPLARVDARWGEFLAVRERVRRARNLLEEGQRCERLVRGKVKEAEHFREELERAMPPVCPFCLQPVKKGKK